MSGFFEIGLFIKLSIFWYSGSFINFSNSSSFSPPFFTDGSNFIGFVLSLPLLVFTDGTIISGWEWGEICIGCFTDFFGTFLDDLIIFSSNDCCILFFINENTIFSLLFFLF